MFIKGIHWKEKIIDKSEYPLNIPILNNFKGIYFDSPITIFVGENGTGKSTFIEALAIGCGLNPEGGSRNYNFKTRDTHSNLHEYLTFIKSGKIPTTKYFLRAESFYNVASEIERMDEEDHSGLAKRASGGSLHGCSHGESFLQVIKNRFYPNGLYILDEPESALSPSRQMSLFILIDELVKEGCQFIIATHSPILITLPGASIYNFDSSLEKIPYQETGTYRTYEVFINHTEEMINRLLETKQ